MLLTILMTILGAATNFILTAASTSLMSLFSKRSPIIQPDRLAALMGTWKGVIHQRIGVARITHIDSWVIQVGKRHIEGTFTISFVDRFGNKVTMDLQVFDGYFHDNFLEARYKCLPRKGQAGVIQFGSLILELSMDGNSLIGAFCGAGHLSKRVVWGPVELTKVL